MIGAGYHYFIAVTTVAVTLTETATAGEKFCDCQACFHLLGFELNSHTPLSSFFHLIVSFVAVKNSLLLSVEYFLSSRLSYGMDD